MPAPAREPRSSPCSTGFSVLPASAAFSFGSGNLCRPSPPQGGSLLPRACEPGEAREDRSCALDPPRRRAERDGGGAPSRTRALRRTRAWRDAGPPRGGGRGRRTSSHPLLERVRVPVCTRARSGRPGQSARCGPTGLTVLSVGSSLIVFNVASLVPSGSVRLSTREPPGAAKLAVPCWGVLSQVTGAALA